MASHNCCFSGGHSYNISCVYVQLCEGWQGNQHSTEIGKTILSVVSFGLSELQQGNDALLEKHVF